MEEELLVKIALLCILVGLPLLYGLGYFVEEREGIISEEAVRFHGEIVSVDIGEVSTLRIVPSTPFSVVVFDIVDFEVGMSVFVEGELDWYNGEVQIIGDVILSD